MHAQANDSTLLAGQGSASDELSDEAVSRLLAQAFDALPLDGKRVLAIIPDGTRTAPIPLLFKRLYATIGRRAARLDYLIALGTHPPMPAEAIDRLVGVTAAERVTRYPNVAIVNHRWDQPEMLHTIGVIARHEVVQLTNGFLDEPIPVQLNRLINDYDHLLIVGPVFPHEVAGFSGGAKYLFPGIAGAEIINATHWLGALSTSMETIGVKDTLVRRVIHRAAAYVDRPTTCVALVLRSHALHGMYIGSYESAWSAAADLSAQLNIVWLPRPVRRVLAMPAPMYDDLWTAAKAMYKTEPVVADGGEIVIYAPHLHDISYTHGRLIAEIGYHVRDYFVQQWPRFRHLPGGILAHSTHVKGAGTYDGQQEQPRISVTLATGISEARCRQVNLGYIDHRTLDPAQWADQADVLVVPHAGEVLYRLAQPQS